MFLSLITGILAGIVHVFVGPDHLAAVGTLAADQRRKTWKLGLHWGLGHTYGVWVIALLVLVFKEAVPTEALSDVGEIVVAATLIVIGLWSLRKAIRHQIHSHEHTHGDDVHAHFHMHGSTSGHGRLASHDHSHAATGIGLLHGLAGSSHLLAVLPAAALPGRLAVAYVIGYGLGSTAAMAVFSWAMGRLVNRWKDRYARGYSLLLGGFAFATVGLGLLWLGLI